MNQAYITQLAKLSINLFNQSNSQLTCFIIYKIEHVIQFPPGNISYIIQIRNASALIDLIVYVRLL